MDWIGHGRVRGSCFSCCLVCGRREKRRWIGKYYDVVIEIVSFFSRNRGTGTGFVGWEREGGRGRGGCG